METKPLIFWCGPVLNENGLVYYKGEAPSATLWSRSLIEGLIANGVDVEGFAPVKDTAFPKGKLIPGKKIYLDNSFNQNLVKYLNIKPLRSFFIYRSLRRSLLNKINLSHKPIAILNYNPTFYHCKAITAVVKKFPDIKWVNIVLDLDDPTVDNWKAFKRFTKRSNGNVFLSWWGFQNAPVKNKLHLDGGCDAPFTSIENDNEKIFVYAGKLADYGGILEIIAAIKNFPVKDVKFYFFGKGSHKLLNDLADSDSRVKIFGYVSEAKLNQFCRQATAFINPRDVNFQGTRMIFPSKLLYYMQYQKPIIGQMLPGLSPEYADILIQPKSASAEGWANALIEVLEMSDNDRQKFQHKINSIITQKTWQSQTKRLLSFIQNIH